MTYYPFLFTGIILYQLFPVYGSIFIAEIFYKLFYKNIYFT